MMLIMQHMLHCLPDWLLHLQYCTALLKMRNALINVVHNVAGSRMNSRARNCHHRKKFVAHVITQVRASNAVTNQWRAAERNGSKPRRRLGTEDSKPLMAELIVSSINAVLCTKLYLRRMEEWRREYHS